LSFPADHSIAFTSLTMTPRVYLNRLLGQIGALGGRIHRLEIPCLGYLSSPAVQSLIGPDPPSSVVLCVGIGALTLRGVEDKTVYPTRGQVVKIKAPWTRDGFTRQIGDLEGGEGGQRTYIIPRPDGEVILGGTREEGDWYPYPRPDTTEDILKRALEICPGLKPANQSAASLHPESTSQNTAPSRQGSPLSGMVIDQLVGFRPSRRDGVRLEYGPNLNLGSEPTTVVYNYGHGGAGWQSCWGTADDAAELVLNAGERGIRARL
jgi:glycine/D-amino acid oxidase-like deaminating enzyme